MGIEEKKALIVFVSIISPLLFVGVGAYIVGAVKDNDDIKVIGKIALFTFSIIVALFISIWCFASLFSLIIL